jgi:hypothetical protein
MGQGRGGEERRRKDVPFCSMSRVEGWARIWVSLMRSPLDEA